MHLLFILELFHLRISRMQYIQLPWLLLLAVCHPYLNLVLIS